MQVKPSLKYLHVEELENGKDLLYVAKYSPCSFKTKYSEVGIDIGTLTHVWIEILNIFKHVKSAKMSDILFLWNGFTFSKANIWGKISLKKHKMCWNMLRFQHIKQNQFLFFLARIEFKWSSYKRYPFKGEHILGIW